MSKFCPIANAYTNCTDNCNSCLAEQEKERLTLNAWGKNHKISFHLANYAENNNLYVGMICYDDGYPEHWGDLTVNLSVTLDNNKAYIDTNNNGNNIVDWLIKNNLGEFTGDYGFSGFCMYPEFQFNMTELMKYVTDDERRTI